MKKMMKKVVVPALLAATMTLGGCFGKKKESSKKPSETYSFSNYDSTYYLGETFSIVGTKLTISDAYGNVHTITVTEDMIISMPDMSQVGEHTVVIEYEGKQYSFKINVLVPSSEYLALEKLRELRDTYKNYTSSVSFDSTTNIDFGYLGSSASYDNVKLSALLNNLVGEDQLSQELYDALVASLVDGTLNLEESDIIDSENLKAKFNSLGATATLFDEITGINYLSYILNSVIDSNEDNKNVAFITSLIINSTAIVSEEGYDAVEEVVRNYYDSLKQGELLSAEDFIMEIVTIVKEHTVSSSIKTAIDLVENYNDIDLKHFVSTIAETHLRDSIKVMNVDAFFNHYVEDAEPLFVTSNMANLAATEYVNVIVERVKAYEDFIFGVSNISSIEDAKSLLNNVLSVNVTYGASMKDVTTLLKAQNWVLVSNQGVWYDSVIAGEFEWDSFEPYYDDQIELFTEYESNFSGLLEALEETGLSGFAYDSGLLTILLNQFNLGEFDSVAYDLLSVAETNPHGFYKYFVDYFFTDTNDYYITSICDYLNGIGQITGTVGQNALKTVITDYFTQFRNAEVIEARDLWIDVLSTINKYTVDDKVRSATESLESLDFDRIAHIYSDLAYISALESTVVVTKEALKDSVINSTDVETLNTSEANLLASKWAEIKRDQAKLYEDVLVGLLSIKDISSLEEYLVGNARATAEIYERMASIYNDLSDKDLLIGTIDDGEFMSDISYVIQIDGMTSIGQIVKTSWDIENSVVLVEEYNRISDIFTVLFAFIESPYKGLQTYVEVDKEFLIDYIMGIAYDYGLEPESATEADLLEFVTSSIDSFIAGDLTMDELVDGITTLIEEHASEETKTALNSIYTMITALKYDPSIDYNEVFKDVPLPEGIESIDYNKLMAKLYDSETYDIIDFENVEVTYVKDVQGKVTGAILTFKIVVDFDAVIAYIDGDIDVRIMLDFQ